MLDTCIPTVIHKSPTDKNRQSVAQVNWQLDVWDASNACHTMRKITHGVSGGAHVTAFRGSRQGFSSLSPNYNPADDCTSNRALLHYSKEKNEYSSITCDTFRFRSDGWRDWSPPTHWQIWWQKRTVTLCTCAFAGIRISCWHSKQQWKHFDCATANHLCQPLITNSI